MTGIGTNPDTNIKVHILRVGRLITGFVNFLPFELESVFRALSGRCESSMIPIDDQIGNQFLTTCLIVAADRDGLADTFTIENGSVDFT